MSQSKDILVSMKASTPEEVSPGVFKTLLVPNDEEVYGNLYLLHGPNRKAFLDRINYSVSDGLVELASMLGRLFPSRSKK